MKNLLRLALVLFTTSVFSQAGHVMQGAFFFERLLNQNISGRAALYLD